MARWIHEFRSLGERALTDGERRELSRRARGLRLREILLAASVVVVFPLGFLLGIGVASDGNVLGWGIEVATVFATGYLWAWRGDAAKLGLLNRRALRLGLVEEFRRVRGDETARRMWNSVGAGSKDEDDEEEIRMPLGDYWSVDERFEESLRRAAKKDVESFVAVGRDGAVLWVEGRPVRKVLEPPVWEVLG